MAGSSSTVDENDEDGELESVLPEDDQVEPVFDLGGECREGTDLRDDGDANGDDDAEMPDISTRSQHQYCVAEAARSPQAEPDGEGCVQTTVSGAQPK